MAGRIPASTVRLLLLALLSLLPAGPPQEPAAPAAPQVVCSPWFLLGPFDNPRGGRDVATPTPLEKLLKKMKGGWPWPYLNETWKGKGRVRLRWTQVTPADPTGAFDTGKVDITRVLPEEFRVQGWNWHTTVYLYRTLEVESATTLDIRAGSDDGLRLWLNGELLVDAGALRGLNPYAHRVRLELVPGTNHLLAKVAQEGGAWAFQAELVRPFDKSRVAVAIRKGADYLLASQLLDGSWGEHQSAYRNGQTALSVYALLKSGLPPEHPAVLKALAWLRLEPPTRTYSLACQMMAVAATGREEYLPWMEEMLADLLSWRDRSTKVWAYPHGHPDLSNTQYAALGLRAAAELGLEIPERVWLELAEAVLGFQERPPPGASRGIPLGFAYHREPPKLATGSMTTAGVGTLRIVRDALGESMPDSLALGVDRAMDQGVRWLAEHWDPATNPGRSGMIYLYYYLYGVERVGSLLGLDHLGDADWYEDGAALILGAQADDGHWSASGYWPETNTAFALLFLRRATRHVVTDVRGTMDARLRRSPGGEEVPAVLVVVAKGDSTFWLEKLHLPEGSPGLRQVEYQVHGPDGTWQVAGSVEPRQRSGLAVERYPWRFHFDRPGDWQVRAILYDETGGETVIGPVDVAIEEGLEARNLAYATDPARNILPRQRPVVSVSTGNGAALVDNSWATAWLCDAGDAAPEVEIRLRRSLQVRRILLSHARTRARDQVRNPRPTVVELWLGREREPRRIQVDPDYRTKTVLEFEEPVKLNRLRLRIVEITDGELGKTRVGFSELEIQGKR